MKNAKVISDLRTGQSGDANGLLAWLMPYPELDFARGYLRGLPRSATVKQAQVSDNFFQSNNGICGESLPFVDFVDDQLNTNRVNIVVRFKDAVVALVVPLCRLEQWHKIVPVHFGLFVPENRTDSDDLPGKRRDGRDDRFLLIVGQMPLRLKFLKLRDFFVGIVELLSQPPYFGVVVILIILSLSFSISGASCDQFVSAQSVEVRDNFGDPERGQTPDPKPEPEIGPPISSLDRVPSRPPHDDSSLWVLIVAAAFLLGFKIATWLNRQHLKRLRSTVYDPRE